MTIAPRDIVCHKREVGTQARGTPPTYRVIRLDPPIAVCVNEAGGRGGNRYFYTSDLIPPPVRPRKWRRMVEGGGIYQSTDGWDLMKIGRGWVAQKGTAISPATRTKEQAKEWIEKREMGQ